MIKLNKLGCRVRRPIPVRLLLGELLEERLYFTASSAYPIDTLDDQLPIDGNNQSWIDEGIPVDWHDSYVAEEEGDDDLAEPPQEVSGSFLTWSPSDLRAISFDDVIQGRSDTCAFTAVLSAVARTDFNLESGIVPLTPQANGDHPFNVRIFAKNAEGDYQPTWVRVTFNGQIEPEDLQTVDRIEYWPALYLRAYLEYQESVDGNYTSIRQSFESLTGISTERFEPTSDYRTEALRVRTALRNGRPVVAASIDDGPLLLETTFGVVHNHAYTVLGVEVPAEGSNGIFVTLRNPWGKDTHWSYFDTDANGSLSIDESNQQRYGIDGHNNGIFRLPWNVFAEYFESVAISLLSGSSINTPMPQSQPAFLQPNIGPFTIRQGEVLGPLQLTARDPNGNALFYSLQAGSPGYIQLQSGNYSWEPPPDASGTYRVTVLAELNPFQSAILSFTVNVESGAPSIGSLLATPSTITDAGDNLVTLTANGVAHSFDQVDFVEFWRDKDGNNVLDTSIDLWFGRDENGSDGWSVTRASGGVTPGTLRFFARAGRYSFSNLFYSRVVRDTITVVRAPQIDPVAIPLAAPQTVSSTANPNYSPGMVRSDAQGNYRVFYWKQPENRVFSIRYNANGDALTGGQQLTSVVLTDTFFRPFDVAMRPDGAFAVVWINGTTLYSQWYSATGSILGSRVTVTSSTSTTFRYVQAATDEEGNLLIAYHAGEFAAEDVYAVSVSQSGSITRAPWRVHAASNVSQNHPVVALNANGDGVIAWGDNRSPGRVMARQVSRYGLTAGPEFIVDSNAVASSDYRTLYAAINSDGTSVISFQRPGVEGGMFARRLLPDGTAAGDAFRSVGGPIAISDSGWMISTGTLSIDPDTSFGVYAQVYRPDGTTAGPRFAVPTSTTGDQTASGVVVDGDADFVVAWVHQGRSVQMRRYSVNLPPTVVENAEFTIAENSLSGTVVGQLAASDPEGDTVRFALVGSSPFQIDPVSGVLSLLAGARIDYESTPQYELTIDVSDNQTPSQVTRISRPVRVVDLNEPPQITVPTFSIPEHSQVGTAVGTISALDAEGTALHYAFLDNYPFQVHARTGTIAVTNPVDLDYDIQSRFELRLAVTDSGSPPQTATETIIVHLTPDPTFGGSLPPQVENLAARVAYSVLGESVLLGRNAVVSDPDSVNWNNGLLRAQIMNATDDDSLSLASDQTITVAASIVRHESLVVGTLIQPTADTMSIVPNANATSEVVRAIIERITFRSTAASRVERDVQFTLNDGHGGEQFARVHVGSALGDINGDGWIDAVDWTIWNTHRFQTGTDWTRGDLNADGMTDGSDFNIWNSHRFEVVDAAFASQTSNVSRRTPRAPSNGLGVPYVGSVKSLQSSDVPSEVEAPYRERRRVDNVWRRGVTAVDFEQLLVFRS